MSATTESGVGIVGGDSSSEKDVAASESDDVTGRFALGCLSIDGVGERETRQAGAVCFLLVTLWGPVDSVVGGAGPLYVVVTWRDVVVGGQTFAALGSG